jgi:hypothetical protein
MLRFDAVFHGDNTGSNPVGDAIISIFTHPPIHHLYYQRVSGFKELPFVAVDETFREKGLCQLLSLIDGTHPSNPTLCAVQLAC